ncbi:15131_t:CDS:1, partial [Acaulospora colombiana]
MHHTSVDRHATLKHLAQARDTCEMVRLRGLENSMRKLSSLK